MKDPFNRACMQWDNVNNELLKWYKHLGEIRRGCKVLKKGEFAPLFSSHKTIAYKRFDDEWELLVAVNLDDETVKVPVGSEWDNAYVFFGELPNGGKLVLPPYRYAMLIRAK